MNIIFPHGNGAVLAAIKLLVGDDGAKRAIDASRSAYGNAYANQHRDTSKDTSKASVKIAGANKTSAEKAKLRFGSTMLAETASNPPLRLWALAEVLENLGKVTLTPESITLPVNLELWVVNTFSPKPEAPKAPKAPKARGIKPEAPASNGNGNGHTNGVTA